jgi:hypothetical protein
MFFSTELTYLQLNGLNAINGLLFLLAPIIRLALVLYIVYLLTERPEGVLVLGLHQHAFSVQTSKRVTVPSSLLT